MTPDNRDSQQLDSYIPVYDSIPEKWDDARTYLVEVLKKMSDAINIREIGWFLDEELLSGKALFPGVNNELNESPATSRQILRQAYDFGPLPNAGTSSIPHNIIVDANFTLIDLWGGAYDPIAFKGIPIPFVSTVLADQVQINMDATNIYITTAFNYSSFTNVKIFIEYAQEL